MHTCCWVSLIIFVIIVVAYGYKVFTQELPAGISWYQNWWDAGTILAGLAGAGYIGYTYYSGNNQ